MINRPRHIPSLRRLWPSLLAVAALFAFGAARASAAAPTITVTPSLQPRFSPSVSDYVTRCTPDSTVAVNVWARGNPVSVDGATARIGIFSDQVSLTTGQAFQFSVTTGPATKTYTVRCLPQDFPTYQALRTGTPQAAYYFVTPTISLTGGGTPYIALYNTDGVPVWWYKTSGYPDNAMIDPNGDISYALSSIASEPFGQPGAISVQQRTLTGQYVNTFNTQPFGGSAAPADLHEAWPMANGDFLITTYRLQTGLDLTSVGESADQDVLNGGFEEVRPDGSIAYSWDSVGHISPDESEFKEPTTFFTYPGVTDQTVWDWQHINSVEPYLNGYLVSFRDLDAIYYIDKATGDVVWKLGGTTTPQSLTILGDKNASTDFGGQHDARVWPDGTVSVFDDGTSRDRAPRAARFSINATNHTARLVQTETFGLVKTVQATGSARLLPGGDWVVAWGATPWVTEMTASDRQVFVLRFNAPYITYRADPILPGVVSEQTLQNAMNTMYPRAAGSG